MEAPALFLTFLAGTLAWNASVPSTTSGVWYYIADGLDSSHGYDTIPSWFNNAGNFVSLAFLNPKDLGIVSDPVPSIYKSTASYFTSRGKSVYFSIGGYAYSNDWTWLSDTTSAKNAGNAACMFALQYGVGVEIDYEGWQDPGGSTGQMGTFIQAFRSSCPMGKYLLTMDLYGSPGAVDWQKSFIGQYLPSSGKPGAVFGNGNYLDFVNIMVIDGQPVSGCEMYWQQWFDTGVLNAQRATFGLIAGWQPGLGICYGDNSAQDQINQAISFLSPHNVYGILSWAVCPPAPGSTETCGDWDVSCNANAPGFNYLCSKLESC